MRQRVELLAATWRRHHPEISRIIWFGSWVNGLPTPGSDVDICLIVTHAAKPRHERAPDYLPAGFPVGLDLVVYTETEFARLSDDSPQWHRAIVAGRDL